MDETTGSKCNKSLSPQKAENSSVDLLLSLKPLPQENEDEYTDNNRLAEYKAVFEIFENENDHTINSSQLGDVMKSMGLELNQDEIHDLLYDLFKNDKTRKDVNVDRPITFSEFMMFMNTRRKEADLVEEYTEAFRVFDCLGSGKLKIDELSDLLEHYGERITKEEIEVMLNDADVDGDRMIDYKKFVRLLLSK